MEQLHSVAGVFLIVWGVCFQLAGAYAVYLIYHAMRREDDVVVRQQTAPNTVRRAEERQIAA